MKLTTNTLIFTMVVVLFKSPVAFSLDFEKEIARQEVVSHSIKQDLSQPEQSYDEKKKVQEKQDFQVVLIPKTRGS